MNLATEFALRAVIRSLFHSDAIDAGQVRAVAAALKDAAGAAMERRNPRQPRSCWHLRRA
jgi:hypothetical protein